MQNDLSQEGEIIPRLRFGLHVAAKLICVHLRGTSWRQLAGHYTQLILNVKNSPHNQFFLIGLAFLRKWAMPSFGRFTTKKMHIHANNTHLSLIRHPQQIIGCLKWCRRMESYVTGRRELPIDLLSAHPRQCGVYLPAPLINDYGLKRNAM